MGAYSAGSVFHSEEAESDERLCLVSSFYTVLDIGVVQHSATHSSQVSWSTDPPEVRLPDDSRPQLTVLLVEAVFLLLVSMFSPWFCDFAQHWFQHGVPVGDFEVQGLDLILAQVRGMVPLCFKLKKE